MPTLSKPQIYVSEIMHQNTRVYRNAIAIVHSNRAFILLLLHPTYSRKLFATLICFRPASALSFRKVSYELNCISTLKCLLQAASQAKKFRGHNKLPWAWICSRLSS